MIALLTPIHSKLSEVLTTYYAKAPDDATMPYIVYNAQVVNTLFDQEQTELEVNVWTTDQSMLLLEGYAKNIKDKVDSYLYADDDVALSCRLLTNQYIEDPDERIRRRQLRFQVLDYLK